MDRVILIRQDIDLAFLISDHFKKQGSKKAEKNGRERGRSGFKTYASDAFAELINNQK